MNRRDGSPEGIRGPQRAAVPNAIQNADQRCLRDKKGDQNTIIVSQLGARHQAYVACWSPWAKGSTGADNMRATKSTRLNR